MVLGWGAVFWTVVTLKRALDPGEYQLNMNSQCDVKAKRANELRGCVSKGMQRRRKEVIFPPHTSLDRPLLDTVPSSGVLS